MLQPHARSARRAVRQDKAEWLKRMSARIRAVAEQMANRLHGASAQKKPRVPPSAKNASGALLACHTGKIYSRIVRTKIQHLLPDAAKVRQSGGIKGGSTTVPQIVLSFIIEKMRKERKCAVYGHQSGLPQCLCSDCVGWSVATRHEGAAFQQSRVELPNPTAPPSFG